MNRYTIGDLQVGQTESFSVTVTPSMVDAFSELSGDINPLHMNEDFAKKRGFPGRVVFGMLAASFFSTLAGVYLPGENCLLHGMNIKFKKPVFIGDTLTVSGTISELSEGLSRITVKADITNQHGKKVTSGIIEAGVISPVQAQ